MTATDTTAVRTAISHLTSIVQRSGLKLDLQFANVGKTCFWQVKETELLPGLSFLWYLLPRVLELCRHVSAVRLPCIMTRLCMFVCMFVETLLPLSPQVTKQLSLKFQHVKHSP